MAKVLVVDDSATQVFQVKSMLEGHGHVVITAENGRDGVALAQQELPDMNGFQATRQLSKRGETQHILVVIVSSKDQQTDKFWGERQGAKGYLTKPVNKTDLLGVIEGLL